ncbi:MAG: lipoate--protein ligase family protein [Gemmatimonadetes bacterium]|nr:MAG: lipoate--protein ligase family protein [Gemmatimonadota bacterium]
MNTKNISWRFLDTGAHGPAYNMAVDEALMHLCTQPTLRVYRWQPYTISFGYGQEIEQEIDVDALHRFGFGYVRRPTGGRAVLHAHELTYSITVRVDQVEFGNNVLETYRWISQGLLNALSVLGVTEAELQKSRLPEKRTHGNPCFTSAGRYEICVNNRKIIGSAQRRTQGHILQHGSFLIGSEHLRLIDCIPHLEPTQRERLRQILTRKTIDLETLLHRPVSYEEVAGAMKTGFQHAFDLNFEDGSLTSEEEKLSYSLIEKYRSTAWNWERKPRQYQWIGDVP